MDVHLSSDVVGTEKDESGEKEVDASLSKRSSSMPICFITESLLNIL